MAIEIIVTGGAHAPEYGGKNGAVGDQLQTDSLDYSGEVSFRRLTKQQFYSTYSTYSLYRFKSIGTSEDYADLIIAACNNPNIGYGQSDKNGIFQKGVNSKKKINCDAASLVSYCLGKVTRSDINTDTIGLIEFLSNSDLFMNPIACSRIDFDSVEPYNGDILIKPGSDVQSVVSGNPRSGNDSEITGGTWAGNGEAISNYLKTAAADPYIMTPRNSEPTSSNVYYKQSYGCTANGSYAWGRFSEILKAQANLCRGVPKRWFVTKEDGYSRGSTPLPGAVMCYTNLNDPNDPGLAMIVEEVYSNNIRVTWRHPITENFSYFRRKKTEEGTWDFDLDNDEDYEYHFQGCIYNPSVAIDNKVQGSLGDFAANARAQVGNQGSFVQEHTTVVPKRDPWAAAFIVAVADVTGGILDKIIPNTYACSNIGRLGVERNMGTFLLGPAQGGNPLPHIGDIILLRTTALKRQDTNKYGADKAGIVVGVGQDTSNRATKGKNETSSCIVEVVMGDVNDLVANVKFSTDSGQISGYFRPNWEKQDGYYYEVMNEVDDYGLYLEGTSLEDAMMRDIRYVGMTNDSLEPSISSGITLAAINYTGMLANFYTSFVESGTAPGDSLNSMVDDSASGSLRGDDDTLIGEDLYDLLKDDLEFQITNGNSIKGAKGAGSGTTRNITITPTVQVIYRQLAAALGNEAAAIGILGNILQENGSINPGAQSKNNACGLCQWLGGRRDEMQTYCEANGGSWRNNVTGQVEFILKELDRDLPGLKSTLQSVPNTKEGAQQACDAFMRKFERCGNYTSEGADRGTWTSGYWQLMKGK